MLNQLEVALVALDLPGGMYLAWHACRTIELECWDVAVLMQHAKKKLEEEVDQHAEKGALFASHVN